MQNDKLFKNSFLSLKLYIFFTVINYEFKWYYRIPFNHELYPLNRTVLLKIKLRQKILFLDNDYYIE